MKLFFMSPECDCCWHLIKLNLSKSLLIYMSSVHTPQKCHRILHKCLSLTKYITISKQFHFVKIRNICDASLLGDSYIGHNDFSQRVVIFHKIRLSSLFTTIPHRFALLDVSFSPIFMRLANISTTCNGDFVTSCCS